MKSKRPKIKLVISDVDATLVIQKLDSVPSKKVIQAVNKLNKKSVTFCCATSRGLTGMQKIIDALGMNFLIILQGGTRIYDLSKKKYIWEKYIDKKTAIKIINFLQAKKFMFSFTVDNQIGKSIEDTKRGKINEITCWDYTKKQIVETINFVKHFSNIHISETGTWRSDKSLSCLHITDILATKQYAVFEVMKMLNINRKNVLGIGDRQNDIPLLSACGFKVAMGNAQPELKQIADFVTKPVWEDGFAYAMEKFVL